MALSDTPQFLNNQYFKTALENGLKTKDIQILDLKFSMGSGPGENFLSSVYRVEVKYSIANAPPKNVSLIVKVVPHIPLFAARVDMHKKESVMYFKILPEIEKGLKGARFSPKAYFTALDEPKTIVLEDLKELGYRLGDRQKGLDEEHCKLVLEKLGKFHAFSMIYAEKNPNDMELYHEGMLTPESAKSEAFEMTQGRNLKSTTQLVETWAGYEQIALKLKKIQSEYADRQLAVTDGSKDTFKVLNHGDMWVNNLLFKYNSSGKTEDVIFVDYQASVYSSPGNDVNQFLGTSPRSDVLINRQDFMIREYYCRSFRETLSSVGSANIPSEDFIVAEIHKKEFYAVALAIGLLPILSMDLSASKDNTLDNLTAGKAGAGMDASVLAPRFQEAMRYLLKRANEKKLLD